MATSETADHLEDVAVRDPRVSDAVDEPMRAMILDMLADDSLTAGEVHERLTERGIDRTENTVRHHINELRDAGLVDVVRFEEGRGGTTKYYGANTLVLSYTVPEGAADALAELVAAAEPAVADLVADLQADHADAIEEVVSGMAPCEHCRTQKYETYVLLTALRRALVQARKD